jgi:hypothetical protein
MRYRPTMRLPRLGSSKLVSTWILITLAVSIVAMLDPGHVHEWAALAPERIWHGQLWRLVTWPLVEDGVTGLVLTCVTIYKFGGDLAHRWGERRLRRFMLQIIVAGGIVATLGALVSDYAWNMHRCGGWVVSDALVIAWARQYPSSTLQLYGFLELGGQRLVYFTIGVTCLIAFSYSPFYYAPELVACLVAAWYPRDFLAR